MIHVVAIVTTKPGLRDEVLDHFRANMPAVHAEAGCLEYVPVIDAKDAGAAQAPIGNDTFMVIEKWETMDHLAAHAASAHMAAYGAKVRDFLASRTIRILESAVDRGTRV